MYPQRNTIPSVCRGCEQPFMARPGREDFCSRRCYHDYRARRALDDRAVAERFWPRVVPTAGCRVWTGATGPEGYGQVWAYGRQELAHRLAWILVHGPIPPELCVLHRCDNPPCCWTEPDGSGHLVLGTDADNMRDKTAKARGNFNTTANDAARRVNIARAREHLPRGSAHPQARVTEAEVQAIRAAHAAGANMTSIAQQYAVTIQAIARIVKRQTWRHLP